MSTGRRHALVIASQCKKEFTLTYLHEAARDLDAALRDGDIGACEPGLKSGESLLLGPRSAMDMTTRIGDAIDYAAANDAILVLALLGHGFIPGESPALYLMGWDSVDQDTRTAVNVRELLAQAANKSRVRSVIGIIDTCTAAAAVPSMADLMTGTRGGLTRLQLLMAAAVNQTAYDMRMSRALTALLRAGLSGADTHLTLEQAKDGIVGALAGQNLVRFDYDGVTSGEGWLARNRQAAGQLLALGAYGTAELTAALRALPPSYPAPADFAALCDLRDRLRQQPMTATFSRASRVTDSLVIAHQTVSLLHRHLASGLTTAALRRALICARGTGGSYTAQDRKATSSSAADTVERAVLAYRPKRADGQSERDCRPLLTRFVVALADEAGIDPTQEVFYDWAKSIDALVPFNNAIQARTQRQATRPMRLIVGYQASLAGEWPDEVTAWLRCDGMDDERESFDCVPANRSGGEKALIEAVRWAAERERDDARLERIEVALPARLLLQWHPEEVVYGARLLGSAHHVVTRWSRRLEASPTMHDINRDLSMLVAEMTADPKITDLHWMDARDLEKLDQLRPDLTNGKYNPAIGLLTRPDQDGSLLDLLLMHVPVLLWPRGIALGSAHRLRIDARWHLLPDGFLTAYRDRWKANEKVKPDLISDIRAVWDDADWLSFCEKASA